MNIYLKLKNYLISLDMASDKEAESLAELENEYISGSLHFSNGFLYNLATQDTAQICPDILPKICLQDISYQEDKPSINSNNDILFLFVKASCDCYQ